MRILYRVIDGSQEKYIGSSLGKFNRIQGMLDTYYSDGTFSKMMPYELSRKVPK